MRYQDGKEVQEGDVVLVQGPGARTRGVIRKVVVAGTQDAEEWSLPEGGVVIEGDELGLFVTRDLEEAEDISFVQRMTPGASTDGS